MINHQLWGSRFSDNRASTHVFDDASEYPWMILEMSQHPMNFDRYVDWISTHLWLDKVGHLQWPSGRGRKIALASTSVRPTAWTGSLVIDRRAYNRCVNSILRQGR